MHVLSWILTGLLAGLVARLAFPRQRYGWPGDLALGSLGGVAAGWLFRLIDLTEPQAGPAHFVVATSGAIGLIAAMRLLLRASGHAATLAGAALGAQNLEARIAKLSDAERRILGRFLRREPVARDPNRVFEERIGLGERAADRLADFGGSWTFLALFATTLIAWMFYNVERPGSFDPYPFILLNLVLSCIAAVQAPIILMSQNRQAHQDRLHAQLDYEVNLKAEMEVLALHEKVDVLRETAWKDLVALQMRQLALLERIEQRLGESHAARG
jgi:uncharacterized membrane protein/uncharacterized membrane protein YeaQ/YmgE (transglycosylase-associated protein family)